jgi:hypothetical protein
MRPQAITSLFGFLLLSACDQSITIRGANEELKLPEADALLLKASEILVVRHAGNDVECPVRFLRSGGIPRQDNFPSGALIPRAITKPEEITALLALPSLVKVVNDVQFCENRFNPSFAGCAIAGSMIVEDLENMPDLAGRLWAHEFGHTKGLPHPRDPDPRAVMNANITTSSRNVTTFECNAFQLPPGVVAGPAPVPEAACSPLGCEGSGVPTLPGVIAPKRARPDIREFVGGFYPDSFPYREAMQYGPADAAVLREMLADPRQRATWPMVVNVLGVIGDDRVASDLIDFIHKERVGRLDRAEYTSVSSAIVGLGFLASRGSSARATRFLMDASDPQYWNAQERMRWTSRAAPVQSSRDQELANTAVMSLGLSGRSEALSHLQARWDALQLRRDRASDAEQRAMQKIVEQAMEHHGRVRRSGLAAYYDETAH